MPKPVCVPCQRFFHPLRNGVHVLEKKPLGKNVPPGTEMPGAWGPYKVWQADSWVCHGCATTIVVGFGTNPLWEDYKGPLPEEKYVIVNDC